jgi:hypothetical protein
MPVTEQIADARAERRPRRRGRGESCRARRLAAEAEHRRAAEAVRGNEAWRVRPTSSIRTCRPAGGASRRRHGSLGSTARIRPTTCRARLGRRRGPGSRGPLARATWFAAGAWFDGGRDRAPGHRTGGPGWGRRRVECHRGDCRGRALGSARWAWTGCRQTPLRRDEDGARFADADNPFATSTATEPRTQPEPPPRRTQDRRRKPLRWVRRWPEQPYTPRRVDGDASAAPTEPSDEEGAHPMNDDVSRTPARDH